MKTMLTGFDNCWRNSVKFLQKKDALSQAEVLSVTQLQYNTVPIKHRGDHTVPTEHGGHHTVPIELSSYHTVPINSGDGTHSFRIHAGGWSTAQSKRS